MKKTLLIIAITIVTSLTLLAQEKAFKGGEFSVDAFGGIKSDLATERSFYGFGLQYYLTENLGIGAYTSLENLSGHTFENVSLRGLWRVPIEKHAFYAFGGATRTFREDIGWEINIGPGYEYRIAEHVGLWTEVGFNKDVEDATKDPYATVRGGIRFSF